MRLKSLLIGFLCVLGLSYAWSAGGLTTRAGINKPNIGDTGWGVTLQTAFDVADSSFAILNATQTFTAPQIFGQVSGSSVTFSSATFTNVTISSANITNLTVTGTAGSVSGSTVTYSSGTITKLSVSTLTAANIVGTITNDNASSGNFGFYVSSGPTDVRNFPATDTYADFSSLSLTAGDWDVAVCIQQSINGATVTAVRTGMSQTSGNSFPDEAVDRIATSLAVANAGTSVVFCTAPFRWSLSTTTSIFQKVRATFSAGNPTGAGWMRARRIR